MTRRRSRSSGSICSSRPTPARPSRSSSISTPPTIRCTAIRRAASSTAYYGGYCYLPLYVFCGRHLLAAKLRRSNLDAAAGAVAEIARIVAPIRRRWPRVRILLRADSGFCPGRPHGVCEVHAVDYLFGLARCSAWRATTGSPPRSPPRSSPRSSPSWRRRKPRPGAPASRPGASRTSPGPLARVGAGCGASSPRRSGPRGEANPRFVVTSLARTEAKARRPLRKALLRARRDGEPHQGAAARPLRRPHLADTLRANQLRLWFASMAYVLMAALRRIGLGHTQFAGPPAAPSASNSSRSAPWSPRASAASRSLWPRPAPTHEYRPRPCLLAQAAR